METKLWFP